MPRYQLHIAEPCAENWQGMTPEEQGRYCSRCRKSVTDFTNMSDADVLSFLRQQPASVCGRFRNDQLHRSLTEARPAPGSLRYFWNLLLATLLGGGTAAAQDSASAQPLGLEAVLKTKELPVVKDSSLFKTAPLSCRPTMGLVIFREEAEVIVPAISGVVLDERSGLPVPYASLRWSNGTGVQADGNGRFHLPMPAKRKGQLSISAIGFQAQEHRIQSSGRGSLHFYLQPAADSLPAVTVEARVPRQAVRDTSEEESWVTTTAGGVSMVRVSRFQDLFRNGWSKLLPGRDWNLYPNPARVGEGFRFSLQVPRAGSYRLEIWDAGGALLWQKQWDLPAGTKTLVVPGQPGWKAGQYLVRVSDPKGSLSYSARLLLQ